VNNIRGHQFEFLNLLIPHQSTPLNLKRYLEDDDTVLIHNQKVQGQKKKSDDLSLLESCLVKMRGLVPTSLKDFTKIF